MSLREIYKDGEKKIVSASSARKMAAQGWSTNPNGSPEVQVSAKPAKKKTARVKAEAEVKETPTVEETVDVELTINDDPNENPNQEENE